MRHGRITQPNPENQKIRRKRATRHGCGALPGTDAIIEAA